MKHAQAVVRFLGGENVVGGVPATDRDFVTLIRRGFPYLALMAAAQQLEMSEDETLSSLDMSKRTAARRKAKNERLRTTESERLLRLARVAATAEETLGSRERARRWLRKQNRALGGEAPIALLDTDVGFQSVMDTLMRIEHGVFS